MRVILLERVRNLGFMGDIVNVKPGYGRNFLLPQKKALRATDENVKVFESKKKVLEAENLKNRQEAEKIREKSQGLYIILERNAGDSGQLYGSVSDRDLAEAISAKGLKIERRQVYLNAPIKQTGVYKVIIALHPEVEMTLLVGIAASLQSAEALIQAELNPPAKEDSSEEKAKLAKPANKKEKKKSEVLDSEEHQAQENIQE